MNNKHWLGLFENQLRQCRLPLPVGWPFAVIIVAFLARDEDQVDEMLDTK
jgi:hypothetical protein